MVAAGVEPEEIEPLASEVHDACLFLVEDQTPGRQPLGRELGFPHGRLTGATSDIPTRCRTLTGFPCSARMRHDWGWVPSLPRGRRCPHSRDGSTTAACRIATAKSLPVRHYHPTRTADITRHQRGFPVSHPIPSLPLTCDPRTEREPLGFPVSFTPGRCPATHVTVGTGLGH